MCIVLQKCSTITRDYTLSKKYFYLNAVLQYFVCFLKTSDHNRKFENSIEGHISNCLFETTHNASGSNSLD